MCRKRGAVYRENGHVLSINEIEEVKQALSLIFIDVDNKEGLERSSANGDI
jgi:hypothetical protein